MNAAGWVRFCEGMRPEAREVGRRGGIGLVIEGVKMCRDRGRLVNLLVKSHYWLFRGGILALRDWPVAARGVSCSEPSATPYCWGGVAACFDSETGSRHCLC